MGKPKAPAAPNYAPIIAAQSQAAMNSQNLANQQFAWGQQQNAADRANTDKALAAANDTAALNTGYAAQGRQRYEDTYVPAEDQFLQNAERYTDPSQVENRAASAAGDVSQQFDISRANAMRNLEAYGVDPTQTRAQALDLGTRTQEAAARASAMNTSRRQDALMGQQMLGTAIQQGQTDAGRGLQEDALGLQAGQAGVNMDLATTASGGNIMGTAPTYTGLANSSLSGASNSMNQQYQNEMDRYKANQASSSGVGSLLGTVAGAALGNPAIGKAAGSAINGVFGGSGKDSGLPNLNFGFGFDAGGAVPDEQELAAQSHSGIPGRRGSADDSQGIRVTRDMSPSRGMQTDDVPARLNAGEFVLPRDTVDWYGQRFLQNLIRKGAQESAGAGARPRVAALPVERPAVSSGALDVRR